MAVKCPQCRTTLNPFSIRTRFKCMTCFAELEGNITRALVITVVLWIVLDTAFRLTLYYYFDTPSTEALVGVGILLAIVLYSVFMEMCAKVKKSGHQAAEQ